MATPKNQKKSNSGPRRGTKQQAMLPAQKVEWMARWAAKHGMVLTLAGECGFGRECVGVMYDGHYPDYADWGFDGDRWDHGLPEVWRPADAYHKHPCVAVLGRGPDAEEQLYQWLKWFDDHNYQLKVGNQNLANKSQFEREIALVMGSHIYRRLVPAKKDA